MPRFFFAAIGLAFLLASEVSFSVGISNWAYLLFFLLLGSYGVDMSWDYMAGGVLPFMLFGAYLGGGAVILYTGRKFYGAVLRRTVGLATAEAVEADTVWAGRILLLSGAIMVLLLQRALGLDLLMSALVLGMVALTFLIVARIHVETGLLFIQPTWQAAAVMAGLFGLHALGPRTLIIVGMLSLVLTIDPRVCLMPLVANALKVADRQSLSPARLGRWMVLVLVVCLAAGTIVTLYVQYVYGADRLYGWANPAAQMPFDMLSRSVNSLAAEYALDSAGRADGWGGLERLTVMQPSRAFLQSAGLGLGLMLVTSAARLRWSWWPIHPVLFMVWGSIISGWFAPSFLLGWLVKVAVTRFGGGRAYLRARPLFIGLIAGEMVMGVVWIVVGAAYYARHGTAGPMFHVHP
jgi:hypothetical protein